LKYIGKCTKGNGRPRHHNNAGCKNVSEEFAERCNEEAVQRNVSTPPTCNVSGISWARNRGCWQVAQRQKPKGKKQHICYVIPQDASQDMVERARLEAITRLQHWRQAHGLPELRV